MIEYGVSLNRTTTLYQYNIVYLCLVCVTVILVLLFSEETFLRTCSFMYQ